MNRNGADTLSRWAINFQAVIMMQMLGGGYTLLQKMAGILGMNWRIGSYRTWQRLWNIVGMEQEKYAAELCRENILLELNETKKSVGDATTKQGLVGITVSFDAGWQQRTVGTRYSSRSGHAMFIGGITSKIISYFCAAKECATCSWRGKKSDEQVPNVDQDFTGILEENQMATGHRCPRNYAGSSKGMECTMCVYMAKKLPEEGCYVFRLVTDDDATTRANMRHSYNELVKAGVWTSKKDCWPKTESGAYKTDYGKIPLTIPEPCSMVADRNHCTKTFGRRCYKKLSNNALKTKTGITKGDCEAMKRNFGYWVHKNHTKDFETFKYRYQAVVAHHFDDHQYCVAVEDGDDGFCKYVNNEERRTDAKRNGKFKDKVQHNELYKALMDVSNQYGTDDALMEVHHPFSSQRNEAINNKVMRLVPKHMHYSKTKQFADRVSLMVIIDSLGRKEGISNLLLRFGVDVPCFTASYLTYADKMANYKLEYSRKSSTKRQRSSARRYAIRLEEKRMREERKSGIDYGPSMGTLEQMDKGASTPPNASGGRGRCKWCQSTSHTRVTSRECPFYDAWKRERNEQTSQTVPITRLP